MGSMKSSTVMDVGSERGMDCYGPIMSLTSLSYSLALWIYNYLGSFPLIASFLRVSSTKVIVIVVLQRFIPWG